jgi:hypothetical protein
MTTDPLNIAQDKSDKLVDVNGTRHKVPPPHWGALVNGHSIDHMLYALTH